MAIDQVQLRTDRLRLQPLGDEHLDDEVELDGDAEVLRYLVGRARTRAEVEQAHNARLADRRGGLGMWMGYDADDEFVGLFMLTPADHPCDAELGYRIRRSCWRQGFAGEGARELIRHGFEDLDRSRIFAQTMAVNVASRATMESLGLKFVRAFHEEFDEPLPGAEHGEVEYELRRDDWLAGR